jgi:hypothetical protein
MLFFSPRSLFQLANKNTGKTGERESASTRNASVTDSMGRLGWPPPIQESICKAWENIRHSATHSSSQIDPPAIYAVLPALLLLLLLLGYRFISSFVHSTVYANCAYKKKEENKKRQVFFVFLLFFLLPLIIS